MLFSLVSIGVFGQPPSHSSNQDWEQKVNVLIFNFEFDAAQTVINKHSGSIKAPYYENLNECLKLLISPNDELFESVKIHEDQRISRLNILQKEFPQQERVILREKAEIHYHWGILKILNKEEGKGIVDLKKSYDLTQELIKKYPDQSPNKLESVFNIAMDQVPQKYSWVMELLGYDGNADQGFEYLQSFLSKKEPFLYTEELLTYAVLSKIIRNNNLIPQLTADGIHTEFERLVLIHLQLEQKNPEQALKLLEASSQKGRLNHLNYVSGQINLYRGRYNNAIIDLLQFTKKQRSERNMKAAYLMLYYAYFLKGQEEKANDYLSKINEISKPFTSKDRYAEHFAEKNVSPHPELLKARLYFDGGYYQKALTILDKLQSDTTSLKPNHVLELHYRKARVYQEQLDYALLQKEYLTVKALTINQYSTIKGLNHFYAAKSCLELAKYWIITNARKPQEIESTLKIPLEYRNYAYEEAIKDEAQRLLKELRKQHNP